MIPCCWEQEDHLACKILPPPEQSSKVIWGDLLESQPDLLRQKWIR